LPLPRRRLPGATPLSFKFLRQSVAFGAHLRQLSLGLRDALRRHARALLWLLPGLLLTPSGIVSARLRLKGLPAQACVLERQPAARDQQC